MSRAWLMIVALATAVGCSSLVSDPCVTGYVMDHGTCVARTAVVDAGSGTGDGGAAGDGGGAQDGGVVADGRDSGAPPDGSVIVADAAVPADGKPPVDGPTCALPDIACDSGCVDASSDPFNCGRCNHVCPTGICSLGVCIGGVDGHVVAIGHDYATHDAAMARVLGNAIGLGSSVTVRVGWYRGTASAAAATGSVTSAASALAAMGRAHHDTQLAGDPSAADLAALDVVVVEAQTGDASAADATGARWAAPLAPYLARGGVVVVLEGADGVSYRLAHGAALYTIGAPLTVTGAQVVLVDGSDAVAQQVPTPYLATGSSVTFPGTPAVFATTLGATVVFHVTR